MLKLLGYMFMLMPLCFMSSMFWMVQNLIFLVSFLFLLFYLVIDYSSLGYFLGLDFVSYFLILLTLYLGGLMISASTGSNFSNSLFLLILILLVYILVLAFSTYDFMMFYIMFEGSLVFIVVMVGGFGYQLERLSASFYLLFYTMFVSLPLLLVIIYLSDNMMSFYCMNYMLNYQFILFYLFLLLAFLVKMPMYMFHLWLPKAHVEAPIAGSMVLAGILLKLGGYGLMRVLVLVQGLNVKYSYICISISLMGGMIVGLMCLWQSDIKMLIAYSSISHMSLVIGGLFTLTYWGYMGGYMMMIGHGLCSSGMFCLANVMYERSGSRSLLVNKGFIHLMPSMSMWWFMLSVINMSAPPSLNLLSEIMLLSSLIFWSWVVVLVISVMLFFSAAYSLYLYCYTQHGLFYSSLMGFSNSYVREYYLMFLHWIPLNLLIFSGDMFMFI